MGAEARCMAPAHEGLARGTGTARYRHGKAKPLFREIRKETLDSLSRGKEFIALVHNDKCIGCTQCVYFCNFASIDMIEWELETRTDAFESKKALIVEDTCTGCTLCVFACPVEAITMEARA